MLAAKLLLTEH